MRIDYDQFENDAHEECNLVGLMDGNFFDEALAFTANPPTPTGAASGRADWIRLSAATNGK